MGNSKKSTGKNDKNDGILSLEQDEFNNTLYIPKNINYYSSSDFEIYLAGLSTKGGLMLGENNDQFIKRSTMPNFIKFTKENIPISLQTGETIQFVKSGLQFTILITNFSNCYLFGDFFFTEPVHVKPHQCHHGLLLKFHKIKKLNGKIIPAVCGEQFILLKDEINRFWYCGKPRFGTSEDTEVTKLKFKLLDNYETVIQNVKDKITHVSAGGRHAVVCVNEQILYSIGNNYSCQLGFVNENNINTDNIDNLDYHGKFIKINWNERNDLFIDKINCCGNNTIILTKCGKLFATVSYETEPGKSSFQLIPCNGMNLCNIGTSWDYAFFTTSENKIYGYRANDDKLSTLEQLFGINQLMLDKDKETKISTGTNSNNIFCYYTENEVIIKEHNFTSLRNTYVLKTGLPIVEVLMSGEITAVLCRKKKIDTMQVNLFKTNGLFDILLLFE
ncbi:hypothetical protein ABK040_015359 [Willaertia magna]